MNKSIIKNTEELVRDLTSKQMDEIESILKNYIGKNLLKRKYLHTIAHEMGHLRTGIQHNLKFGYIRVSNIVIYMNSKKELTTILLKGKLSKSAKKDSKGVCYVYAEENMAPLLMKFAFLSAINAGPLATRTFCNENKGKMSWFSLFEYRMSNPSLTAPVKKIDEIFFNRQAIREGSDQYWFERINNDSTYESVTELNAMFRAVGDALILSKQVVIPKQAIPVLIAIKNQI